MDLPPTVVDLANIAGQNRKTLCKREREKGWGSMSGSYAPLPAVNGWAPAQQSQPLAETGLTQWFAVQTRHRFEKTVVSQLSQKGCEVYLPLLTDGATVRRL
jgi:hypothetical protein